METLNINYDDFIATVIIVLNDLKQRRIVTLSELNYIKSKLIELAKLDNKEFWTKPIYDESKYEEYIESINVEDETIYRLKPLYKIEDLRYAFASLLPMDLIILLYTKEIYTDLDDQKTIKEKYGEYFKKIDEEYQLKLMYQYYVLKKAQSMLKKQIKTTVLNSNVCIDENRFECILEASPDISCDKLIRTYQKR